MISKDDIKKLADLARIEIEDSELDGLAKEVDSILGYVGQIKSVVGNVGFPSPDQGEGQGGVLNVMREDENPNESGAYTKELLAEAPETERGFIKVKKIL